MVKMAGVSPTKWRVRDRVWYFAGRGGKGNKNRACFDTFYDRTFSRAYSDDLETAGLFLSLS